MKKLLSIIGAVGITATGASVVVSCGNKTTGPEVVETNLANLVSNKNVKVILGNERNKSVILDTIIAQNSKANLTKADLKLTITGTEKNPVYTLTSATEKYTGEVLITVEAEKDLTKIFAVKDFTLSSSNNDKDVVKEAIFEANKSTGANQLEEIKDVIFSFANSVKGDYTEVTVKASPIGSLKGLTGQVKMTVKWESDLAKLVTNTTVVLGDDSPEVDVVLNKVIELNPSAALDKTVGIKFDEKTKEYTLMPKADSKFTGNVLINVKKGQELKLAETASKIETVTGATNDEILDLIIKAQTEANKASQENLLIAKEDVQLVVTKDDQGNNVYTLKSVNNGVKYFGEVTIEVTFKDDLNKLNLNNVVTLPIGSTNNDVLEYVIKNNTKTVTATDDDGFATTKEEPILNEADVKLVVTTTGEGKTAKTVYTLESSDNGTKYTGKLVLNVTFKKSNITGLDAKALGLTVTPATTADQILEALNKKLGLTTDATKLVLDKDVTIKSDAAEANGSIPEKPATKWTVSVVKASGSGTNAIKASEKVEGSDITLAIDSRKDLKDAEGMEIPTELTSTKVLAELNTELGLTEEKDKLLSGTDVTISIDQPTYEKDGKITISAVSTSKKIKGEALELIVGKVTDSRKDLSEAKDMAIPADLKPTSVLAALNTELKLEDVAKLELNKDVTISVVNPQQSKEGKVTISAVSGSKKIKGETLEFELPATTPRKDLKEAEGMEIPTTDLSNDSVLAALNTELKLEDDAKLALDKDVTISIEQVTTTSNGKDETKVTVKISAVATSKKVKGETITLTTK